MNKQELLLELCKLNRAIMYHSREFSKKELNFLMRKRERIKCILISRFPTKSIKHVDMDDTCKNNVLEGC